MPWSFAIPAIAGVAGAVIAGDSAEDAANTQAASADRAAELSQKRFEQTRQDNMPWLQAGTQTIGRMASGLVPGGEFDQTFGMDDFQADPGYEFRRGEGLRAVEASALARGGGLGGRTMKELMRYGQDYGSNEFNRAYDRFNADIDRRFNRLASVSGVGQTSANNVGAAGMTDARIGGDAIMGGGNARASGYIGSANAVNAGIGAVTNAFTDYRATRRPATIGSVYDDPSNFRADDPYRFRGYYGGDVGE